MTGQVRFANSTGPGWGRPSNGSFEDNRIVGRDGKRYGPLSNDWLHFKGMYRYANRSILSYQVGTTEVLESPSMTFLSETPLFNRHFNLGPRERDLIVQIAEVGDLKPSIDPSKFVAVLSGKGSAPQVAETNQRNSNWQLDGSTYAQFVDGNQFDMYESDFTIVAQVRTRKNGTIFCKTKNWAEWIPDGKSLFIRNGRLTYDIGWVGAVTSRKKINDGKWHDVAMTWSAEDSKVTFYIDGKEDQSGTLTAKEQVDDHAVRVGYTNEDFPSPSYLDGNLKRVRFYQRRLTADELQLDANPAEEDLLADWKGISEGKLVDRSGNKRNMDVIAEDSTAKLAADWGLWVSTSTLPEGSKLFVEEGCLRLKIAAGDQPLQFTVVHSPLANPGSPMPRVDVNKLALNLNSFIQGGPKNHPEILETRIGRGKDNGPFAVDVLTEPKENPWNCRVRLTGIDFLPDGDKAICSAWDGSVWKVSGIKSEDGVLSWQRIASGLFQPLGVKIRDGEIFITCRDQLVRLHDLNGDGEMDWYENFNSDHQVTEHFHEFAMGLQTDDEGNFYYAKSARHALKAIVPHHGTLLKVSRDGSSTEIVANGFRAANGVCLNPDGTFYVTDQEGHWNPKNRINWVQKDGFYGNMFGYHDVTDESDEAMDPPMCWITNSFDRSPSELMWVDSEKWGPLNGTLLNFSYGYGQIYVVPHEKIDGQVQGGMCAFPATTFPNRCNARAFPS